MKPTNDHLDTQIMGRERIKENGGGGELKYDQFDIL
jgi:hypothetical protein